MHEIAELADECTVFRNGRNVATYAAGTKTDNEVVEMMIGREYSHVFPPQAARAASGAPPVLEVAQPRLGRPADATSRSSVRAGEVVGLGGLDGQGQRELLLALFGVLRGLTGDSRDRRQAGHASAARSAAKSAGDRHGADPRGPQDRRPDAADVGARQPLLRRARPPVAAAASSTAPPSSDAIDEMIKLLAIKTAGTDMPVGALSGGNQQKVVIAKWLMTRAAHHPAQRSDARHRRRHQAGDLPAAARAGRRRRGDPVLLDRL